jgi:hypothetical protein
MGPAHRGIGFADDGEHEPNVRRRIAAYRQPLSVQPSEICLSGSLPIAHWFFRYGMAIGQLGPFQDGIKARRALSRLLLGVNGSSFRLRGDEPAMGRRSLHLCLIGENNGEPLGEPSQWFFVH